MTSLYFVSSTPKQRACRATLQPKALHTSWHFGSSHEEHFRAEKSPAYRERERERQREVSTGGLSRWVVWRSSSLVMQHPPQPHPRFVVARAAL